MTVGAVALDSADGTTVTGTGELFEQFAGDCAESPVQAGVLLAADDDRTGSVALCGVGQCGYGIVV